MACCGFQRGAYIVGFFTMIFSFILLGLNCFHIYLLNDTDFPRHNLNEFAVKLWIYIQIKTKIHELLYITLVFNALWCFASFILIGNVFRDATKKIIIIYIGWIIIGIINIIVDLLIIGFCASDLNNLVVQMLEIKLEVWYMVLIAARAGVIFIFEISCLIYAIVVVITESKKLSNLPKTRMVPLKEPKPVLKKPKDTYPEVRTIQDENVPRVMDWYKHYENNGNENRGFEGEGEEFEAESKQNYAKKYIPRLADPPKQQNLNYRPSTSSNNNGQNPTMVGSNTNFHVNGVPSGTLRRQLPWSYIPENANSVPQRQISRTPPVPPPKPHVPAPDYDSPYAKPLYRRDLNVSGYSQYL